MFDRLYVVGIGLIGGSVALAARAAGLCTSVIGADVDPANLDLAQQGKVIDSAVRWVAGDSVPSAVAPFTVGDRDVVCLAIPVGQTEAVLRQLAPGWNANALYTDAGSTKATVIEAARAVFGRVPANFIPAHPVAGAEQSGVAAACADLFQHRRVLVTPVLANSLELVEAACAFWRGMGALVETMDATHHDHVLAATSHVPHLLAFALVDLLGRRDETVDVFRYAAGGFRDFTRIASSDPVMWRDICLANHGEIAAWLRQYQAELGQLVELLEQQDGAALFELFVGAREARQRFLNLLEGAS